MDAGKDVVFALDYYNDHHKSMLLKHRMAARINGLVSTKLRLPEDEFFTYMVFVEQSPHQGFRNYSELRRRLPSRIDYFRDYLDTTDGTVRPRGLSLRREITERVGVSTALLLMNRIFNLHQADWERIPESNKKTMDFSVASDGTEHIIVEAKGRTFRGSDFTRSPDVESDVKAKKDQLRSVNVPKASLFGVLTVIPTQQTGKCRCFILDPPEESLDADPAKSRLLARIHYYTRLLTIISAGQVVRALRNRLSVLSISRDYTEFDGTALVDVYGRPIIPPPENYSPIWNKTVSGDRMVGHVFPLGSAELAFFGVDMDIFKLMIEQRFRDIVKFESRLRQDMPQELLLEQAKVDIEYLQRSNIPFDKSRQIRGTKKAPVDLWGKAYYDPSGLVFGIFTPRPA